MEFVSIWDNKINPQIEEGMSAFFVDLNLDQVLGQIQGLSVRIIEGVYFPDDTA